MKITLLKIIPFLISLIIGTLIYCIAVYIRGYSEDLNSLLINISATLIGISTTYCSYSLFKQYSDKKLNKILFDYAKERIDNEITNILMQIQKMVYSFDNMDRSFDGLSKLLDITKDNLDKQLSKVHLLGYQIFKKWDFSLNNIEKVIENPYTMKYLTNEQIISLVKILQMVEHINAMYLYGKNDIFENTKQISRNHMIIPPHKSELPERSILLKRIPNKHDEGIVVDSGDISLDDLKNSLYLYKIKNVKEYSKTLYNLILSIRDWVNLSGNTIFIILKDKRLWNPIEKRFVY